MDKSAPLIGHVINSVYDSTTEKHTVIFDFDGTGFHQFDMRALMLLKSVAESDQDYYPERLARLFIINAPCESSQTRG